MKKFFAALLLITAFPIGLYIWLKWGWYDGFVMAFNAIMNEPKDAGAFAWGVCKVLIGGALGAITAYILFFTGFIMTARSITRTNKRARF